MTELKGIESASEIDPGCTLFTTESNYGHVTFDIQKLAVKPARGTESLMQVKNLYIFIMIKLWQSIWSRSDIQVGDHFVIDESMVDNAAR